MSRAGFVQVAMSVAERCSAQRQPNRWPQHLGFLHCWSFGMLRRQSSCQRLGRVGVQELSKRTRADGTRGVKFADSCSVKFVAKERSYGF